MSSKSTIILTDRNEHIYQETNEPRHALTRFIGFDIHFEIDPKSLLDLAIKEGHMLVRFNPGQLRDIFGEQFYFNGQDIVEVAIDDEGVFITIAGGSYTAKKIYEAKEKVK